MWETLQTTLSPFVWGGVLALVLDMPRRRLEQHLTFLGPRLRRGVTLALLTGAAAGAVCVGVWLLLPQLAAAVHNLAAALPGAAQQLRTGFGGRAAVVVDWVQAAGGSMVQPLLAGCAAALAGAAAGLGRVAVGFVLALYLLAGRETNLARGRRLLLAVFGPVRAARLGRLGQQAARIFSGFVAGQCAEACILAGLFVLALWVCGMPYVLPISAVVGVTALVPVFGAWAGGILGAVLVASAAPEKLWGFVVLFVAVQQLENHVIYPRVVGARIGLPPLLVLGAVLLGGGLLGAAGLLLGIPAAGVLYHIGRRWVHFRLDREKKM